MTALDPIPGKHPRLLVWAQAFRSAGWSLRTIAALFNVDVVELTDAGVR